MLLDDALEIGGRALAIPHPIRIHHCDRPAGADAQTIDLRAQHAAVAIGQIQLLETALQEFPGIELLFARRTGAVGTEKDVSPRRIELDLFRRQAQRLLGARHYSAASSVSPVRMRIARPISVMKILPSPTLPVFAALMIASIT